MGTLRFAGDLSLGAAIAVVLIAASLVAWLYLRETKHLRSPYNYLLPGLRASAVALAILILAGPVLHRRITIGTLGRVVFALDASESMSLKDDPSENGQARLTRAIELLVGNAENDGWLESLKETHQLDVVSFSDSKPTLVWSSEAESELPSMLEIEAGGKQTDLSRALTAQRGVTSVDEGAEDEGDSGVSAMAVVLMSDGRSNVGESPIDVASQVADTGVKIHAIGMGQQLEPADAGIVDVIRPESVATDGQLSGEIILKTSGFLSTGTGKGLSSSDSDEGKDQQANPSMNSITGNEPPREVTVRIESGDQTVWTQRVSISDRQQSIPFNLDVESVLESLQLTVPRGVEINSQVLDLRAAVDAVPGDAYSDNDTMAFRVAASTRARRLLIMDGSSRWEIRYLRNLFSRDPVWEVDSILFGPGTDQFELPRGDEPGEFPDNQASMAKYDAIILGEIPPDQFEETDADRLRDFVRRGGGLIVLDGRYGRIRQLSESMLSDLIPITYETPSKVLEVERLQPTAIGADQTVLSLWGNPEEQDEFWKKLPPPLVAPSIQPQPDAEVLAEVIGTNAESAAWLVTRLYGSGRVFYFSTDQTWRWRYKVADRFHSRFWNQMLASAMQPPYAVSDQYTALGTDEIEYEVGQSATIRAKLQGASGDAIGDATVDALLIQDDQVIATVPLSVDDPDRGTYRGKTLPLESGAYRVRIQASGFDAQALQASTPIWVGTREAVEMSTVALDVSTLEGLTDTAGGRYFHETDTEQLLETLRPLSSGTVIESDIQLWQSYYWFVAILLLLAAEWWLRKRAGLV